MPLTFDDNVPAWLRRICTREYKRLNRQAWEIHAIMIDGKETTTGAQIAALKPYPKSTLYLKNWLGKDQYTIDSIRHEFLHTYFDAMTWRVANGIPKRSKGRALLLKNLHDDVEYIIQSLVKIL